MQQASIRMSSSVVCPCSAAPATPRGSADQSRSAALSSGPCPFLPVQPPGEWEWAGLAPGGPWNLGGRRPSCFQTLERPLGFPLLPTP